MDRGGNLYGTTSAGGAGCGTVFKLTHTGSAWVETTLYTFQGGMDGAMPQARVVFGPDGTLYGTTTYGGSGAGTVFNLRPPATFLPQHPLSLERDRALPLHGWGGRKRARLRRPDV